MPKPTHLNTPLARRAVEYISTHADITVAEIVRRTGVSNTIASAAVRMLYAEGRVHISGWQTVPGARAIKRYSWGNKEDVPNTAAHHNSSKHYVSSVPGFVPHPDPAAAWMFNKPFVPLVYRRQGV